jgi:NADPH:quinone reductase-like Zn-dependent oxidoreductase
MFIDEYHTNHPKILGEEFVGEVEEAGSDSGYKVGDVVCGFAYGGGKPYDGAYAEYTICHKQRTLKLPDTARDIPWEVLGAVPMGLWTAYGSIFSGGQTKPGDTVFVHGATSSVGIWAILVCKDRGCKIIASTRQKSKIQKLKDAGADYVVLEDDLENPQTIRQYAPNGVNTVLEIIGLHKLKKVSMPALAKHGTCVLMGILGKVWSIPNFGADFLPPCRYLTTYTTDEDDYEPSLALLAETVEKIRTGVYKKEVFLDSVFDLKDVGKAHERMEANVACGKIVLRC